jgi:NAD(P)H-hydrate repair Nnr-like enzyme with NAD(P)H-hydrate dehydratase domain
LLARGLSARDAGSVGAFVHGLAGRLAGQPGGPLGGQPAAGLGGHECVPISATDVLHALPRAFAAVGDGFVHGGSGKLTG